jgi:hypothetical protein
MYELFGTGNKPKKQMGLTFDITKTEEKEANTLSQAEQLATVLAKTKAPDKEAKNPYAFWKAPIIKGKGGGEGLTLDKAVALAGLLASSINPPDIYPTSSFGGRLGQGLYKMATEGGKAHEEWETQQKAMGLEERKVAAEEKRIAKPTEIEAMSGLAGPEVREKFIGAQERIRAPHPSEIALSQARTDVEKETQQLKRKELELIPEEFKMKQAEHQTRLGVMDLEKKRLDLEIEKLGLEKALLSKGETKETIQGVRSVNSAFDNFVQSWMTKHVYTPDDEKSNYLKNAELAASVQSHIAGVKSFTDAPEATEKSVRYWFSQVDREFDRPALETGFRPLGVGITGAGPQAIAEQGARRRYYVKAASSMLQQSGTQSMDMFQTLSLWATKAGYSDQEITNLLAPFGIRTK